MKYSVFAPSLTALALITGGAQAQDLVVDGSLCVGIDCPGAPAFGADTIRLQEDNLRIHFEDVSGGAFPANDWRIVANDSTNGGDNYLAFEDVTGATMPFRVDATAPENALRVVASGRVGLGTGAPVVELHVVDGNSPSLRLEQDGSDGFAPRAWDLVGNESNFFVRDTGNSDALPFRIIAGATDKTLIVAADGSVGIGLDPTVEGVLTDAKLHVEDATAAKVLVRNTSDTQAVREMFRMENEGGSYFTLNNSASGRDWFFTHENNVGGRFIITSSTNPAQGLFLDPDGDMQIGGTLTENSDKNAKMAIVPVDTAAILDKVAELPVSTWTYKDDTSGSRHVGPMAQDFYAAFGLGATETGIATLDTSGIALASIKALHDENEALKAQDAAMKAHVEGLTKRLATLEQLLQD